MIHHYGRIHGNDGVRGRGPARVHRKALVWRELDREGMPAFPAHPRYLYEMAAQFLLLGMTGDAVSHARTGLDFEPRGWHFWNIAGLAHLHAHEHEKANACFRSGISLAGDSAELLNNLGASLMSGGEPAEALIHFERAIGLEGGNADILRNAASASALTGDLESGLAYVTRALAIDPFTAHAHAIHADILYRLNDIAGARDVLKRMRFLPETPLKIYLKVIQLYTRMGMADDADAVAWSAIHEFPNEMNLWYLAGKTAELRGDGERARSLFRRVLAANPRHVDALNSLGCVYEREGKLEEALSAFREALRGKEGDAKLEVNMGIALDKLGRFEEAGLHFERALKGGAPSGFVYNALGCHLAMSERQGEALACFSKAVELEADNAVFYRNLGLACEKMNLFERAAEAYEKMASIDPEAAPAARERLTRMGAPLRAR
jgi:tetratricopeptide (TPR) repeat protein